MEVSAAKGAACGKIRCSGAHRRWPAVIALPPLDSDSTSRPAANRSCAPGRPSPQPAQEPWLAETSESPSPSHARSASGVTIKPRSRSGTTRIGLSSASTAVGAGSTRRTKRPADAWRVTASARSSARLSVAHAASSSRAATASRGPTSPASRRSRSSPWTGPARPASTPTTSRPELLPRSWAEATSCSTMTRPLSIVTSTRRPSTTRRPPTSPRSRRTRRSRTGRPPTTTRRRSRRRAEATGAGESGYAVRGRRGRPAHEAHKDRPRVIQFLIAVWAELQRVQWPNRQALVTLTGVVLGFVLIAGGYLGLLDAVFSKLIQAIL